MQKTRTAVTTALLLSILAAGALLASQSAWAQELFMLKPKAMAAEACGQETGNKAAASAWKSYVPKEMRSKS